MILLRNRLMLRFLALGILIVCLSILSRSRDGFSLASQEIPAKSQTQFRAPSVIKRMQPDAPLAISSLRVISWDGQDLEAVIDLVNVSEKKAIRGYAIGKAIEGEETRASGQIMFISLDLSNSPNLAPNRVTTTFDVHQVSSEKEKQIVFFIDYVEFSDGTIWGTDSGNSAQRSAGQRAAAHILSKRLLAILNSGNSVDVLTAIEKGAANIEPPPERSVAWKEGFRSAQTSISQRLKMLKNRKGTGPMDIELRQLAQRFEDS